ncbi:MAG: hypothetical protein J4G05_12150, partial [Chlorobi bacterium]|nr:hypothetical protein [Chlorobiota bacterium]
MKFGFLIPLLAISTLMLIPREKSHALFSEYLFEQTTGSANDMTGSSLAIGANVDDGTAGSFDIGFPFDFDDSIYTTFTVSTNGWMKLGLHTFSSNYINDFSSFVQFPVITAFWDDLRTYPGDGYIRYQTEGSPGSRVLTVEWRVRYWSSAATASGPWVYQVRLYEGTNVIEFFYIDMPSNYNTTATIGMASSTTNWMSVVPGSPRATASTTVQRHNININVTPITAGTLYRFRRVLDDLACDSVWFDAGNSANSYLENSAATVSARLINLGANPKNNIPFQFDVYDNKQTLVYSSEQAIVSPGNRFGTATHTFNAIPGTINDVSGIYEVYAYPTNPVDEDYKNDTCKLSYFILGQNDIIAFRILSPFENVP